MKFFQKTGVAVAITVLAIAAALFIGLSPVLKSGAETAPVQTVSSQDTSAQTSSASLPASESTASGTAGDETISNKYIRDEAGLFTRSAENTIKDYTIKFIPRPARTSPSSPPRIPAACRSRATPTARSTPWA